AAPRVTITPATPPPPPPRPAAFPAPPHGACSLARGAGASTQPPGPPAIARAVDAEPVRRDLRLGSEKGERRLYIGNPAVRREPGPRPFAVAPSLVVEIEDDISRFCQGAGVIGQINVPHPGIAVAEHDPGALLSP